MSEIELLDKLYMIHETRKSMFVESVYHNIYLEQAVALNKELEALTGRNYTDYSVDEVKSAMAEVDLLTNWEVI